MQPQQAIVLPYMCGQNEPSRPMSRLISFKNIEQLQSDIVEWWQENFGIDHGYLRIKEGKEGDYGDLIVTDDDDESGDAFLYLTLIES